MTHYNEDHRKFKKFITIAFKVFFAIIAVIVFALLFGYLIMWLWNWLMPDLFGLNQIGYWQAVGILVLAKMLFGGFGGHNSRSKGKRAGKRCRNTQKNTFNKDISKWKFYDKFWEEEGESAYKEYVKRLNASEGEGLQEQ